MGERGMADMTEMSMPLPDNTAPMMTGQGPFGSVEMGGMFSVLKVRRGQPHGDYRDPGWYAHPPGTSAREVDAPAAAPPRQGSAGQGAMPRADAAANPATEVRARKPTGHGAH